MWPQNVPHNVECDILAEHARQVCGSVNDAKAKDQLAALLSHLSQQIASSAKVGEPEPMYPNSQASTSNAGYGSSGQGQSSYGSGGSPSYGSNSGQGSGSGSRGSGGSGSGHGSDSRSGGGSGSGSGGSGSRSDSGSGSGGSDGYCGDGSTGSEEDGSDSSGNDEKKAQIQQATPVKLPPGLVENSAPNPVDPPMKVEDGNDRKLKNKAYHRTKAPTPTAMPTPAPAGAAPGLLESQAPALKQDGSPLAVLLQDVLWHVAMTFPPEDTISLCSALANSLAGVIMRERSAQPPQVPGTETMDPQTMYFLQQEIQRQQSQISSQFAAPQFLPPVQNSMPFVAPDMPSCITTEMLDTAHNLAINAAQQAAAAWQKQQASVEALAWEQAMLLQQANGFDASMARKPAGPVTPINTSPFPSDPPILAAFISPSLPMGNTLNLPSYLPTEASGYNYPGHLGVPVPTMPLLGFPCLYPCAPAPSVPNSNGGSVSGKGNGRSKGANNVGDHRGLDKGKGKGKKAKAQDAPAAKGTGKGCNKKAEVGPVGGPPQIPGVQPEAFDKSLRSNLEALHSMDSNRIVLTRKINRLGFESASVLEAFFAKYGKVDRVLVSHCHAKSRNLRFRPSGLGFLVMSCVAEAEAILADGPELEVCPGTTINVQPFKSFDGEMEERR